MSEAILGSGREEIKGTSGRENRERRRIAGKRLDSLPADD